MPRSSGRQSIANVAARFDKIGRNLSNLSSIIRDKRYQKLPTMNLEIAGWLLLFVAPLYTLYVFLQLYQGETTSMKSHGFTETIGGYKVSQKDQPVHFWFLMALRGSGVPILWVMWWLCWFGA